MTDSVTEIAERLRPHKICEDHEEVWRNVGDLRAILDDRDRLVRERDAAYQRGASDMKAKAVEVAEQKAMAFDGKNHTQHSDVCWSLASAIQTLQVSDE